MVYSIFFSPAYSTRKIAKAVAEGVSDDVIQCDITQEIETLKEFLADDFAVIAVSVYSGRVPVLATEHLNKIKANGTPAIVVCVYGNREYEDALLELKNICTDRGFVVLSAGAFIARHSIFPQVAGGRPDANDLISARDFGIKSWNILVQNETKSFEVKGNFPYRLIKSVPLTPKGSSECNNCGSCASHCPTNAIDKNNPRKTDKKKCISCARCIEICPQKARNFGGLIYKLAKNSFVKKYSERKEVELFFPV